ncbi:hypothetical protein QTP88_010218 [Uroleucon formosanum]
MPRERRANIGRRTRHASQQQVYSRNLREERQNIIRENDRLRHRVSTRRSLASYNRLAFQYDPTANYSDDENLDIGRMTTICRYCNALKFKRETVGLCCASGKVKLDPLLTPPQPLKTLFDGSDIISDQIIRITNDDTKNEKSQISHQLIFVDNQDGIQSAEENITIRQRNKISSPQNWERNINKVLRITISTFKIKIEVDKKRM